jgi:hypothetical protein
MLLQQLFLKYQINELDIRLKSNLKALVMQAADGDTTQSEGGIFDKLDVKRLETGCLSTCACQGHQDNERAA